jgi:hypothetical protein
MISSGAHFFLIILSFIIEESYLPLKSNVFVSAFFKAGILRIHACLNSLLARPATGITRSVFV